MNNKTSCFLILTAIAFLAAGCISGARKKGASNDDAVPYSVSYFDVGAHKGKADFEASFFVQQGRNFSYRVISSGVPIRITITGGMPGKVGTLDQKEGVDFIGSFMPAFTGLAFYKVEVIKEGVASGEIIQLTKFKK